MAEIRRLMTEPKCPKCEAEGTGHFLYDKVSVPLILSDEHTNFMVIYCDQCGYVYNVLPKK